MSRKKHPVLAVTGAVVGCAVVGVIAGLWAFGPRLGIWIVPPTPERYGNETLRLLDRGLYAEGPEWADARRAAQQALDSAGSFAAADAALADAVAVAGGHHSAILTAPGTGAGTDPEPAPSVTVDRQIATALVPEFTGDAQAAQAYADTLADGLVTSGACGVVVDLRGNGGGDMGPMLAGLSPLLPDGDLTTFVVDGRSTPVRLTDGAVSGGGTPISTSAGSTTLGVPVAVLTDSGTGSSGEQVAIAFRGLDDVRSFGEPTAGYASVNQSFTLYSGSTLVLTVGETRGRDGTLYGDRPIEPDEVTGAAEAPDRALAWLRERCG